MSRNSSNLEKLPTVVLVGAGPGDPDLMTVKAVRALRSADVILHDDLVSKAILDLAHPGAQRIRVGKRGGRPSSKQHDINQLMIAFAMEGQNVIRLKGGDPMIFGRAGEEIAACRAAGIAVEVIPGVTAALGAAASLGVSLTHRDWTRRLQFITAHDKAGGVPGNLDWEALADPTATTAIYMGKGVLNDVAARLIASGLAPDTPAVIVENATHPNERIFHATVGSMAQTLSNARLDGPCVILIGKALGESELGKSSPDLL